MIRSRTVSLLTAALLIAPQGAFANPLGANVVGGQATVQGQGSALVTVTQSSQNAIINWNTFNLGAGDLTKFVQPNSSAIALNRVTGGLGASQIYGTISANGRVFLINPYGILFGAGSQINTAGFLASTNDIKNRDFMHGHYNFNKPGHPDASIVNLGNIHITPSSTGFAALVAPGVRNAGTITANLGHVALASGNGFTLDFYGDKLITLKVGDQVAAKVVDVATGQPLDALVKNEGRLRANGGQVELTAAAARHVVDAVINNTGTIEANTVGTKNGMIVLGAATAGTKPAGAPVQKVKIAGKLSVSGHKAGQTGGTVVVTGEDIALTGAKINASGQAGGGTVLIGGDTGGGHVNSAVAGFAQAKLQPWPVATATTVSVDAASVIDASAKTTGNGGKVVVWSDQTTNFAGLIKARGGALSGNGGFVEVSSHGVLRFNGLVDLRAPFGTSGTLLLDPQNVTICSNCTDTEEGNQATLNGGVFAPGGNNSTLEVQTLQNQLGLSDVVVTTGTAGTQSGDITVIAPVGWSTANTLTLNAAHDININSSITATKGGLTLDAGHNISAIAGVNVGTFTLQKGSWSQVSSELPTFSAQDFRLSGGTFLRARGGEGFDDSPYKIADIYGLQGIGTVAPSRQNFELARSIDASGTVNWNSGAGFAPIGQFSGTLDGNGHKISGLTIAPTDPNVSDIGLFGINFGTVRNLTLSDVTVFANPNSTALGQHIGTVAGQNLGMISNVSVGASSDGPGSQIIGGSFSSVSAGGLAGQNFTMPGDDPTRHGVIKKSSADVAVTIGDGVSCPTNNCGGGWNYAGGLVGFNAGTIAGSSATGNVISGSNSFAGGLVGASQVNSSNQTVKPRIINSFATGNVTSDGTNVALGGLVGYNGAFNGFDGHNGATIKNSYAWGDVTSSGANATLGGLVGANDTFGRIKDSHATGNVTSTANLPSANCSTGDCQSVIAGGLVGQNEGKIKSTFSFDGASSESFGLGLTYATGDVSVGQNATAGGLVGFNDGIIRRSVAIGNVTGGSGSGNNEHDRTTTLGGLVGENQGVISGSFAAGTVGSVDAQFITAGGFVGENGGTIKNSAAFGDVVAGANSVAGGFVGDNTTNNGGCDGCMHGIGFNQNATIKNALAFGAVTVGSSGLAGGFAGSGNGRLSFTGAFGPVTGGDNSVLGGLVGALSLKKNDAGTFAGSIDNSVAFGPVTSTGPNSIIGGLVGINGGDISLSAFGLLGGPASGPGNNVSDSFVSRHQYRHHQGRGRGRWHLGHRHGRKQFRRRNSRTQFRLDQYVGVESDRLERRQQRRWQRRRRQCDLCEFPARPDSEFQLPVRDDRHAYDRHHRNCYSAGWRHQPAGRPADLSGDHSAVR
jgi:filamentous hemagglutinin family protein